MRNSSAPFDASCEDAVRLALRPEGKTMSAMGFPAVDLKQVLSIEQLPGMPQTAVRLVKLSRDSSLGAAEFAVPIEADPGLTVQVLRLVNSSYFGFRCKISNIKQAIALVGVRTIKNFVLWNAIFTVIPNPRCCLFDLKALWQDSLRRALFARALSKLLGVTDVEETFAAGLLQDMAIPLLARKVPDSYSKFFYARCTSKYRVRLSQLEEHAYGWNHAMAAGVVAKEWQLPETLVGLIQDHLAVSKHLTQPNGNLGRLAVAMSALLPAGDDAIWVEFPELEAAYSQIRPLDGPSTEELLGLVDTEFAEVAPLLRIAAPRTSLIEKYHGLVAAGNRVGARQ
jgi:HD-like signal output (HDOD) protein